jgi:hypothetical protein
MTVAAYHTPDLHAALELRERVKRAKKRLAAGDVGGVHGDDDDGNDDNGDDDDDDDNDGVVVDAFESDADSDSVELIASRSRSIAATEVDEWIDCVQRQVAAESARSGPDRLQSEFAAFESRLKSTVQQSKTEDRMHTLERTQIRSSASGLAAPGDADVIQLAVRLPRGGEQKVRVKRSGVLQRIVDATCAQLDPPLTKDELRRIVVRVDRIKVPNLAKTVGDLGLQDGETIVMELGRPPLVAEERAADEDSPRVRLVVRDKTGGERTYTLAVSDPLSKLMRRYCSDVGCKSTTEFEFDGELVDPDSSAKQLELEDDDQLTFVGDLDAPPSPSAAAAEAAAAADDSGAGEDARITLRVRDKRNAAEVFTVKLGDPLSKVFRAFCEARGIEPSDQFEFDGDLVGGDSTAAELGLEDDDLLTFIG